MKAKLIVEGKEFDIDIFDPELVKIVKPEKKTGYERVGQGDYYYYTGSDGSISECFDNRNVSADDDYECADYYSDEIIAKNNARADKLMRQLRRFAVEHRTENIRWKDTQWKHYITYDYEKGAFNLYHDMNRRDLGVIYFDSVETAEDAIETFHDELIWYFTEYKDSL